MMNRFCLVFIAAFAAAAPASAQEGPLEIGAGDAEALFRLVRGVPSEESSPRLDEPLNPTLILTLYGTGAPVQRVGEAPTLRDAGLQAGRSLLALMDRLPDGRERFDEARLKLDVVTTRAPLDDIAPGRIPALFRPGMDGLACATQEKTVFLTPLAIFRHWHEMDVFRAAYAAQESLPPPEPLHAERIETVSFIEETPAGRARRLYRGNVLVSDPSADEMVQAVFHAGLWLLRMQGDDGAFPAAWSPAGARLQPADPLLDHLRAVSALSLLDQISGDPRFRAATDEALRYALDEERARIVPDRNLLYLPGAADDVTGTALLLTALCHRAMLEGPPTANRRMVMLGEFLADMTEPDGRLRVRYEEVQQGTKRFMVRGTPYAESLLALSLLQRISPTAERGRVLDLLADILLAPPADTAFRESACEVARTIEAFTEYYKVTRSVTHAEAALRLADDLVKRQYGSDAAPAADYVGGFPEGDLPPESQTVAAVAAGIASAYELRLLMRRATDGFSAPMQHAAFFLMNLQYRPENAFFISNPLLALGALRKNPQDLSIRLSATTEAIRALIGAATVTAETRPPEPPDITLE